VTRKDMWSLYGRLVTAGHEYVAVALQREWDHHARLVRVNDAYEWVAEIDATQFTEVL
jgi:hypothetical protein